MDGSMGYSFWGHEDDSGSIVRGDLLTDSPWNVRRLLLLQGLTNAQILYIAECATYHFELGKVRRAAQFADGYTLTFAATEHFREIAIDIISEHPELNFEIGLLFLADNLSKIEPPRDVISSFGVDSRRAVAAAQQAIHLKVAEQYLRLCVAMRAAS